MLASYMYKPDTLIWCVTLLCYSYSTKKCWSVEELGTILARFILRVKVIEQSDQLTPNCSPHGGKVSHDNIEGLDGLEGHAQVFPS